MPVALAVFAHPDDIELTASGTLLRLQRAGYEIHYMTVANGSCGSSVHAVEELVRVRRDEAIAACRVGGFTYHESLVSDLEVFYDRPTLAPARCSRCVASARTSCSPIRPPITWKTMKTPAASR